MVQDQNHTAPPEFHEVLAKAGAAIEAMDFERFEAEIAEAERLSPGHPEIPHFKGLAFFEKKKTVRAFELVAQAAYAMPENPFVRHNLAAIQISLGKFDDAEINLRNAIKMLPEYAEAFHTLAGIRKFEREDPLIQQMEGLARNTKFNAKNASFLCFALAKAYDDSGRHRQAWAMLTQANACMDSGYDLAVEKASCTKAKTIFTHDFIRERMRYGHPSTAPIFIVGMPRSGTTLLESLLDAHPQVYAAGEQGILAELGKEIAKRKSLDTERYGHGPATQALIPAEHHGVGQGYLNAIVDTNPTWFDYCVDKMPDNSFNLGLVATTLPNARVLHITRHPLDIMLSIYFQRFTSVPYGFRPDDILNHWHNYQDIMQHWRNVLPTGMLTEISYESLVQDKDFAQSWLWDHLGLTDQVSHIGSGQENLQQRTASRWQVKQPVYTSSRYKFRKYAEQMSPFIEGLGGMAAIKDVVEDQKRRCALRHAAQQNIANQSD